MSDRTPQRLSCVLLVALASFVGCGRSATIVDRTEWPPPMSDLLSKYPKITSAITTYKHDAFVDTKFAWKIVGQADEVSRLIDECKLKQATSAHVKFEELQHAIPDEWSLPNTKETVVFASDGYGDKHQEGTDLLLLVRDPGVNETFVLYQWIFWRNLGLNQVTSYRTK